MTKAGKKTRKMRRRHLRTSIPAILLYDSTISLTEAFVLAEIDALDGEDGCWAMNDHFAVLLRVSNDRAGRIISELEEKGRLARRILPTSKGKSRYLSVVWPDASHTVKTPDGHTVDPPQPYGENTVTPPVETPYAYKEEVYSETNREGNSSPPLSEKDELKKLYSTAKSGDMDQEQKARFSYLNTKGSCPELPADFLDFFETEVLSRFDKYFISDTLLRDWNEHIYQKYGQEISKRAVSYHRSKNKSWQANFAAVVSIAEKYSNDSLQARRKVKEADDRRARAAEKEARAKLIAAEEASGKILRLCDMTYEQIDTARANAKTTFERLRYEKELKSRKGQ